MTTEMERLQSELKDAMDRYKIWCEAIDNKKILKRNTAEEIAELDRDIKKDIIMPIIAKIKWLQMQQNFSDDEENSIDLDETDPYAEEKAYDEYKNK